MSFPENISRHRVALLEMLEESFRDPARRTALKTRGISMQPLIQERDEVVIQALPLDEIQSGDLIAYRALDVLVVHRVAAIVERPGGRVYYEKGDNNLHLSEVAPGAILGVAVEIVAGRRRLDLRRPRFRRLGRAVARTGLVTVKGFAMARAFGAAMVAPGSVPSRTARRVIYTLLQLPVRIPLWLARRWF